MELIFSCLKGNFKTGNTLLIKQEMERIKHDFEKIQSNVMIKKLTFVTKRINIIMVSDIQYHNANFRNENTVKTNDSY